MVDEDNRYQFLYEFCPIALAESDCTDLKDYIEECEEAGVNDFREYFEINPDAVLECMNGFKVISVNKAMVEIFEAENKEQLMGGFGSVFSNESLNSFRDGLVSYTAGKTSFEYEVAVQTYRGNKRYLSLKWTFLPGFEESRTRMMGSFVDITPQKKLEHELKKFSTATDNSNFGNLICDLQGTILYVNDAHTRMFGCEAEELLGKDYTTFLPPEHLNAIMNHRWELARTGRVENVEVWLKKRDGTVFPALSSATIIQDDNGNPEYACYSTVDITAIKQLEQELKKEQEKLTKQNSKLEEMNSALRILIQKNKEDRDDVGEEIHTNTKQLVMPIVSKLKMSNLDEKQKVSLDALESALNEITSPFMNKLLKNHESFTPAEMRVAKLIRDGSSSKEIAELMNLSLRSVETYRGRLRKKLDLTNKKANLRTHLLSLPYENTL